MADRPAASRGLFAALCFAVIAAGAALAADSPARAPSAALASDRLIGFIQYIRWPGEGELRRWDVCVAPGQTIPDGEWPTARGRPIVVRALAANEAPERCQILDLTGLTAAQTRAMLDRTRRTPVVTIGDGEAFCTAGGVICTRAAAAGGGFEVNLSALQDAGLAANAQLLMLGRRRQTAGAAP
jgi:hypothetical protein